MYRILIKRDGFNALTGKAQYRAVEWSANSSFVFDSKPCFHSDKIWPVLNGMFGVVSNKIYPRGCFINPRKALGI
jgi:hypothetical protein